MIAQKIELLYKNMSIYLSFINKPQFTQQIVEKPAFQAKHKITINRPAQAHFTVEGVQAYSPQQIKALKSREDRISNQGREGSFVAPKVVLLSDQIIEFDQRDPLKEEKNETKQLAKTAKTSKKDNQKNQKVKTNARNAVSANNQTIVKLEKQVAKRNSLQRKLQKMSTKYKQFFKDVDLKQGFKISNQRNETDELEEEQTSKEQKDEEDEENKLQEYMQEKQQQEIISLSDKYDKTTYHRSQKNKQNRKQIKKQNSIKQDASEQNSYLSQSRDDFKNLGIDLVGRCSTYSEKLGTAIHQMFK